MKNLIEFLLIYMVDHPADVSVTEETDDYGRLCYRIKVHDDDYGLVIGSNGNRIKAIRKIVSIPAILQDKHPRIIVDG